MSTHDVSVSCDEQYDEPVIYLYLTIIKVGYPVQGRKTFNPITTKSHVHYLTVTH